MTVPERAEVPQDPGMRPRGALSSSDRERGVAVLVLLALYSGCASLGAAFVPADAGRTWDLVPFLVLTALSLATAVRFGRAAHADAGLRALRDWLGIVTVVFAGSLVLGEPRLAQPATLIFNATVLLLLPVPVRLARLATGVLALAASFNTLAAVPPGGLSGGPAFPNLLTIWSAWGFCLWMAAQLRETREGLARAAAERTRAEASRDALARLLPVCAYCRQVRDDAGYWQEVSTWLARDVRIEVDDALCGRCERKAALT